MSIICEEIFDDTSHPSVEEIKDYATKIGIDPENESQLLPLAAEGLMRALPPDWKPCYDDASKSYYYYNNLTKKTQWEHPLDDIYRGIVKKVRAESQSLSLNDQTEDATYIRDDLPSFEENPLPPPPKKLDQTLLGARKKEIKLSPLKLSPKHESKFCKQKSEEYPIEKRKISLFSTSFDTVESTDKFEKHPRSLEKSTELKLTGGGAAFLKSNSKKQSESVIPMKTDLLLDLQPKSILRERSGSGMEQSKSMEFDKLSLIDKSDKDDEDKKSVRFNLDNNTDIGITFSDKSSSEEEIKSDNKKEKPRVSLITEPLNNLKLIKPNPTDFIKPKLTLSRGSDSEEDSLIKNDKSSLNEFFDEDKSSDNSSCDDGRLRDKEKKFVEIAERKLIILKQNIWEEKNDELMKFKTDVKESHKEELERILIEEKSKQEGVIKKELENLRMEMDNRSKGTLTEEKRKLEKHMNRLRDDFEGSLKLEEDKLKLHFETKRDEIEKYYEEKLADIEKELAERVEKNRDELILNHNATMEQLKQNHAIIIEEVKRQLNAEEQSLRQEHNHKMLEFKTKISNDLDSEKYTKSSELSSNEQRSYDKLRCEKRLLEDKYKCLKEKYLRLKTDVKSSIEKRNKRKEQQNATNTTGSETEQSHSNAKERTPLNSPSHHHKLLDKPPTPKHSRTHHHHHQHKNNPSSTKNRQPPSPNNRNSKQDIDTTTSTSDCCDAPKPTKNLPNNDDDSTSDLSLNNEHGRSRKKLFSRLKSSSTSRLNNNNVKTRKSNPHQQQQQRSCSPVENLRRQLQKLEDLEDQFPQQADTYHLRYPFSDGQKFEGSSELEFFRHRIHLERDSIKRAKESLRSQKMLFQQRQKELKLKHGTMARHTLQQLCQEEKELTDMEVSLHRTRSLLGEKVIRLRHLEQSLQRANMNNEQMKQDDATLSDLSSHSASSGISSTEFATADATNFAKNSALRHDLQESSEIIQSLENLNSEIREIWDVLRTQQQQSNMASVMPPLVYPDLGWPILAGTANLQAAPPSIPTLADRLHNYRQQVALANAQSTIVTHAANQQGATTTLVERTRNLRHWLRQTGMDASGNEGNTPQATL